MAPESRAPNTNNPSSSPPRLCFLTPLNRRGPWTLPEFGAGSWPLALGADLFPYEGADWSALEAYDVLVLHVAMGLYEQAARLLDRFAHKAIVLRLTSDAMFIDPQGFFPGWRIPLGRLADRARLVLDETGEVAFFQAMTATPVVHLPNPLPLAALRRIALEAASSPRTPTTDHRTPLLYLGSGFLAKKNGIATALAFRLLRERLGRGARGMVFAEEPEAEREAYARWGIEGVDVLPCVSQPELWRRVAGCDLALHLDYRRTVGRFPGECAALGVPCVSTAGAAMQRACFPELIVDPWDVEGAAALAARLLRDPLLRDRAAAATCCSLRR